MTVTASGKELGADAEISQERERERERERNPHDKSARIMNKAFVREPEHTADYCPRCGSKGEVVGVEALKSHLTGEQRRGLGNPSTSVPRQGAA